MAIVEVLLPSSVKISKDSQQDKWSEVINSQIDSCAQKVCSPGKNPLFPNQPDYIEVGEDGTSAIVSGETRVPITEQRTYIVTEHPEDSDSLLLWGVILNV